MPLFTDSSPVIISRDVPESICVLADADLLLTFFMGHASCTYKIDTLLAHLNQHNIQVHVTDLCLKRVSYYLSRPPENPAQDSIISWFKRRKVAAQLKALFQLQCLDITHNMIQSARQLSVQDFDMAVEVVCAKTYHLDAIVTQKQPQQFEGKPVDLKVWSLGQFLTRAGLEKLLNNPG
ncbi:PIN domain-containing protein [Leptothoe spongobia]|uniref:PIN domain-containing protein n=1 Tax=Leptothoe spongobia TAU-MAC 1115 TaxID=1967444 RepID=A0A947DD05_9CYAN|nr:PIN domain-containing protein [Leptothoe spongobia]MBT9314708.1 hypothetical protein [Leptothoe spongobia TAU-MAC 1115]